MTIESEYIFNSEVVYKESDSVTLVYNDEVGEFMELNDSGSVLFSMCMEGLSIRQMIDGICNEFSLSEEEVVPDVLECLSRFVNCGIISLKAID